MTRAGTLSAARPLDELFCITRFPTPSGPVETPVSWSELARDRAWASSVLHAHGVSARRGHASIVISSCDEPPLSSPFEQSLMEFGITYTGADAGGIDVVRIVTYLRRLPVAVIVGIDAATLDGLAVAGDPHELMRGVEFLYARPDAIQALRDIGLQPRLWAPLGPTVAVQCTSGDAAHVNGSEWHVDCEGNELRLTSLAPRARPWKAEVVGKRWHIVDGPCSCGSSDPSLVMTAAV